MRVKEKSIKAGLKLNIQKTKIMASSSITSWQIEGKKNANWQISFCWAPKSLQMVTVAMKFKDACSLKESYDKLDSILKIRDITLLMKAHIVKAMVFPVVMYGCESWTTEAEH